MNQAERRAFLIDALVAEEPQLARAHENDELMIPADAESQRRLLRALMNVRPPRPIAPEMMQVQDAYLQKRLAERGGAVQADDLEELEPRIALWRGDITLLAADAIVNAANAQGLGCFAPNHGCIDNAIHTYAGIQLRLACAEELQNHTETEPDHKAKETIRNRSVVDKGLNNPRSNKRAIREIHTGEAIITPGFNLPAKHVIHTVGPIVSGPRPTPRDRAALASCYRSCLELARERGLNSIAFCCISTGVFRYPQREAARVAVSTVRAFLRECEIASPQRIPKVVFNVFTESDYRIYRELLC